MPVSRSAAWAAASVTRTVLMEIIDGARRVAAEARKKLNSGDLLSAIDRNVELEVGSKWYDHSPTFRGMTGVLYDADGAVVPPRKRSRSRKPSAVVGAHGFEAGVKKLLWGQGVTAVPATVRDLDGIASVFLTDLAHDAAMVVREGGIERFGTVAPVMPGEPAASSFNKQFFGSLPVRRKGGWTIGTDHILAATTMQLLGGDLRRRALTEAREATGPRPLPAAVGRMRPGPSGGR
ncbi:hypothetical protein GCM10010279_17220 [Streptomyces mutabilis]|nr:hypothetical protein GCM10010279_17220 [Streptomyces mutabilis]